MTIIRGHIIELNPNNKQVTYFNKACGVARLSYNWALAEWQKQYQADKDYRDECQKLGIMVDESKLNNLHKANCVNNSMRLNVNNFPLC